MLYLIHILVLFHLNTIPSEIGPKTHVQNTRNCFVHQEIKTLAQYFVQRKKNGILHFFVAFISERTVQQKAPLLCVILLVFFVFNLYVLKRICTSSINVRFFVIFFFQIFFAEKKNCMRKLVCCLTFIYFNLSINRIPFSSERFEPRSHFITSTSTYIN